MDYAGQHSRLEAIRVNRENLRFYMVTGLRLGIPIIGGVLLLAFSGVVHFFSIIFLCLIFILAPAFMIAKSLQCPSCGNSSFSMAGIKAYPFCDHCQERVFSDPDFERDLKDKKQASKKIFVSKEVNTEKAVKSAKHDSAYTDNPKESLLDQDRITTPFTAEETSSNGGYVKAINEQDKLVFKPTKKRYGLIATIIFFAGAMAMVMIASDSWGEAFTGRGGLILLGAPFCILWALVEFLTLNTLIFDKMKGIYSLEADKKDDIKTIAGLQVLSLFAEGKRIGRHYVKGATFYQLNLILKDGSRQNIMFDIKAKNLQDQAQTLADYLDVPLWHDG